jgi:hypothetical protein
MEDNEHIETLRAAREKAVQQRRQIATELAGNDKGAKPEELQKRFVELHALVTAIDHAIDDEATGARAHWRAG